MQATPKKESYHTLIIGAGIAGLNAARFLRDDALIIDQKDHIGYPVRCGEGISTAALEREDIAIQPQWVRTYIDHIKRIMPNGRHIGSKHDSPYALVIHRPGFEKHLAEMVPWEIRMNTRILKISKPDAHWIIETDAGDTIKAKYLVGADGPNSVVAKTVWGIKHKTVPGINYSIEFEKEIPIHELHMFFGSKIAPCGYAWMFPTSTRSANAGLTQKNKGKIKTAFFSFLNLFLKPSYGNYELSVNKSGVIPVAGFTSKNAANNVFLTGDAGGFTDPIFEGGMNMALFTGRLAATSINQDDPATFNHAVSNLPFTSKDLVKARNLFYSFDDDVLNALAEVIDGQSTSFLSTPEGQKAFKFHPPLLRRQKEIFEFARIWQTAKPYIW